jgi:hypothetical protein
MCAFLNNGARIPADLEAEQAKRPHFNHSTIPHNNVGEAQQIPKRNVRLLE